MVPMIPLLSADAVSHLHRRHRRRSTTTVDDFPMMTGRWPPGVIPERDRLVKFGIVAGGRVRFHDAHLVPGYPGTSRGLLPLQRRRRRRCRCHRRRRHQLLLLRFRPVDDAAGDNVVRWFAILLSAFPRFDYARQTVLRIVRPGTLVARDTQRVNVRDTRGTGVLLSRSRGTVRVGIRLRIRGNHRRRLLLHGSLRRLSLSDDSRRQTFRRAVHVTRHGRVRAIMSIRADERHINGTIGITTVAVVSVYLVAASVESPG